MSEQTNTPRVEATEMCSCCTCGYTWIRGRDGSHHCSTYLQRDLAAAQKRVQELEWLLKAIVDDLPVKRDWLNPDFEKYARAALKEES